MKYKLGTSDASDHEDDYRVGVIKLSKGHSCLAVGLVTFAIANVLCACKVHAL